MNPEDFSPVDCPGEDFEGWGEVHLFDVSDPAAPELVGAFSTPDSCSSRDDGFYSVHNTEVAKETQAFSSWYTDGIVWWDFADPANPVQRGQFVPPGAEDPTGTFPPIPMCGACTWTGTANVVLASDMNSGLWILRPVGLGNF